jgi:peroxiredoxin (alkyl hydroperoxide reductase subunit C)
VQPLLPSTTLPAPLRIGERAADFTARSTRGPLSLSEYRGRWVVLFSHPADFTPVCTSEFVAIARAADRFAAMDCALMALSVDSLFSHLAWIRAIHDRFGVRVEFPVIEDPTMAIARAYGMVAPDAVDASEVRATFFIDPDGVLAASSNYPANVGRSVDEILRTVAALQRAARGDALVPADWTPGADVLAMPDQGIEAILAAEDAAAWFYTTRAEGTGA